MTTGKTTPDDEAQLASAATSSQFAWISAATIFLGAFLLFQVQPIISKMILPWFGGGPAVWTTCMLFFQVALLGGYAYAHYLLALKRPRWQLAIHLTLLVVAAVTLPIIPSGYWKPTDGSQPANRILLLLAANVGLPYFMLATTGPLVQAWFSRAYPAWSPYRLYALSNIGSLGALLTYPFLIEPLLTTNTQGNLWSGGFVVYALVCGGLTIAASRLGGGASAAKDLPIHDDEVPSLELRFAWLVLPALASMMLLTVTNHVCQDIAVVPFFWVAPLSLYLISFIICFDREAWYHRPIVGRVLRVGMSIATVLAIVLLSVTFVDDAAEDWLAKIGVEIDISDYMGELVIEATLFLSVLFLICMVCHGELVRCKPSPKYLTSFYLLVSAGGAIGGLLVALVCPQVFSSHLEMGIGLIAAFMLSLGVVADDLWTTWLINSTWKKCAAFALSFGLLCLVVRAQFEAFVPDNYAIRNFYGILQVDEDYPDEPQRHVRELLNGRILHGAQYIDEQMSKWPTTYYSLDSGIGLALTRYPSSLPLKVATVGLGTGTIATYADDGDDFSFYEINPNVVKLAESHFTFLHDARERHAEVSIKLGDARISMEREPDQQYHVIALDAFSGDAIPAHLLTLEAFEQYFRHLRDDGIIAVHISNRHLDLTPVVGGAAEHFGIPAYRIEADDAGGSADASSDWILLTHNTRFVYDQQVYDVAESVEDAFEPIPLWTDQFSNLWMILD